MEGFNKVILMGNLTRDPQLKFVRDKTAVCEFGIAVNKKARDGKEKVCFVDVTAWGKQAEVINEHFRKGKPILIEGSLDFRQWEDQTGAKRSKLSVTLSGFQFLPEPRTGGWHERTDKPSPIDADPPSPDDDDLPF